MDNLDLNIIDILQNDGRASNAGIARIVGVSEGTVRRRLKKMMDDDLIEVRVVPDPDGLGRKSQAIIGVQVDPDRIDDVLKMICELPEITYAATTTGGFDLFAWVGLASPDQLGDFLIHHVGCVPGVRRTETFVVLESSSESMS